MAGSIWPASATAGQASFTSTWTAAFTSGWAAAGPFAVGRGLFGGPANWFTGRIDQVRVWNRALSGADISALV